MAGRPHLRAHVNAVHDHLSPPAQVSDQPVDVLDFFDFRAGGALVPFGSELKLMKRHLARTAFQPRRTPSPVLRVIGSVSMSFAREVVIGLSQELKGSGHIASKSRASLAICTQLRPSLVLVPYLGSAGALL